MANGEPLPWTYHGIGAPCQAQHFSANVQVPSIAEQMGVDPISKLADAINNLADALRTCDASES